MRLLQGKNGAHMVEYLVILAAIVIAIIAAAATVIPGAVTSVMSESANVIRNSPG